MFKRSHADRARPSDGRDVPFLAGRGFGGGRGAVRASRARPCSRPTARSATERRPRATAPRGVASVHAFRPHPPRETQRWRLSLRTSLPDDRRTQAAQGPRRTRHADLGRRVQGNRGRLQRGDGQGQDRCPGGLLEIDPGGRPSKGHTRSAVRRSLQPDHVVGLGRRNEADRGDEALSPTAGTREGRRRRTPGSGREASSGSRPRPHARGPGARGSRTWPPPPPGFPARGPRSGSPGAGCGSPGRTRKKTASPAPPGECGLPAARAPP